MLGPSLNGGEASEASFMLVWFGGDQGQHQCFMGWVGFGGVRDGGDQFLRESHGQSHFF